MRPRIQVQWGKHGSIPFGAEQQRIRVVIDDVPANQRASVSEGVTVAQINELTFRKLSTEGARLRDHGLARGEQSSGPSGGDSPATGPLS